jgi:hypothetical protein
MRQTDAVGKYLEIGFKVNHLEINCIMIELE